MVPAMILSAPATIKLGILEFFLQRSSVRDLSDLKGESKTAAKICYDFLM